MSLPVNKSLFRQNAINHLKIADEIYPALRITHPGEWLGLIMVILILTGFFIWGMFGTLIFSVEAHGILIPDEKLQETDKSIAKATRDLQDKITALEDLYQKKQRLFTQHYITLDDLLKTKDALMAAQEGMANPERNIYMPIFSSSYTSSSNAITQLDALVFVDQAQGKKIAAGMSAFLLPDNLSPYDAGYIHGEVISISEYPVSKQQAYAYLGNINLVDDFFVNGAPFVVRIKLQHNPVLLKEFFWTAKHNANISVQPGTMVSARVIYKKCSPIKLIMKK